MAPLVGDQAAGLTAPQRLPLLLYLASNADPQRMAVGPALAGLAVRAGWRFECYYDRMALGRHFGGGDPAGLRPGLTGGSPVTGGQHGAQLRRLADRYRLSVLGDPASPLWPVAEDCGAELLAAATDPAALYAAFAQRCAVPAPALAYVLDASGQGAAGVISAPYLAPHFLLAEPALGIEVGATPHQRSALAALGVRSFVGLYLDPQRAASFPGGLDRCLGSVRDRGYAEFTSELVECHRSWAGGVLLADPDLAAAQLSRLAHRRLLPIYGRPQIDVLRRNSSLLRDAVDPVLGRQYDDRDFFELARYGKGLQVVDPGPPFEANLAGCPAVAPLAAPDLDEPSDAELRDWAEHGRRVVTLCFWVGMIRELDGLPRLLDLALDTGLRAGLVLTSESVLAGETLALLSVPVSRGGVAGRLEPLLGSTGHGVAVEAQLPAGTLRASLADARRVLAGVTGPPRGYWPLLDAALRRRRILAPVGWRDGGPRLLFASRQATATIEVPPGAAPATGRDLRAAAGHLARRTGAIRVLRERRPFEGWRPGGFDPRLGAEVAAAGFDYMFTKSGFGASRLAWRQGQFVAVPFTAGNWDGWSPFYTVAGVGDLQAAARRGKRAWIASSVDSPLFALAGEIWSNGALLHKLARYVAAGGRRGRLVNVTPHVLARYARLLDDLRTGREAS